MKWARANYAQLNGIATTHGLRLYKVYTMPSPSHLASPSPAPHPHVESVLLTEEQICTRIEELGCEIKAAYGPDEELTLISIINGAIVFTSDLLRELENPIRLDCIRISSYRDAVESRGVPQVVGRFTLDIAHRHVLVIDDILDTGKTLDFVTRMIREHAPASLRVCVLLDKKERRTVDFEADFVGFSIPDQFVIGYGLDFAERYRNLRYIGTLKPQFQKAAAPLILPADEAGRLAAADTLARRSD